MQEYFEQKDIPGTDGWYQATTDGRIWSCKTGRFLKPAITQYGYHIVALCYGDKKSQTSYLVHRLVALTWLDEIEGYDLVDHINENKLDNRIENLRWVNHSLNMLNQSKVKGCYFHKASNKWMAKIEINRKHKYLGIFDTKQEARDAYLKAKSELVTF